MFGVVGESMAEFFGYCSAHSKDVAGFILFLVVYLYTLTNLGKKIGIWNRTLRQAQRPSTLAANFKDCWDLFCTRDYYVLVLILLWASTLSAAIIRERLLRWLVTFPAWSLFHLAISISLDSVNSGQWEPRVIIACYSTSIILLCFWICFNLFWKVMLAVWSVSRLGEAIRVVLALFGTSIIVACFWISLVLIKGFWRLVMKIGGWK